MVREAKELYLQGRESWRLGEMAEAEQAFRQAIELDPQLPHPHFDLATLLEQQDGAQAEILDHYQRFLVLAADNPELTPQVRQVRQRLEGTRVATDTGVLTTEVLVSKVEATRAVQKGLKRGEQIAEGAPKILVPLWRVRYRRRRREGFLYLSGNDGMLLRVEKKRLRFTGTEDVRPRDVAGLDGKARFERRMLSQLTQQPLRPRFTRDVITSKVRNELGVDALEAELMLFPVWQFTVTNEKTGVGRQVVIDSTFGLTLTRAQLDESLDSSGATRRRRQPPLLLRVAVLVAMLLALAVLLSQALGIPLLPMG
jgi:tetratricopeptide (TPR) repeat protein